MTVSIRHAQVKDAPILVEAEREIAKEPGFFCSQPSELKNEDVTNTIKSLENNNKGVFLVAEKEDELVGHAFLEPMTLKSLSHVADLNIVVHKGWQGKGIGRSLLEEVITWAKNSSNLEKIQLNVRASNQIAISLYKKMGFQEEGRIKNKLKIKDSYLDDIVMGLMLNKNPSDILIREMTHADIETVVENFSFSWTTKEKTVNKWKQYFIEHEKKKRTVYLIQLKDQIIGYASLLWTSQYSHYRENEIPEIHDVWVHENFRKKGFGQNIIDYLEQVGRTQGYQQIGLGVGLYADYGSAQILYSKMGYVPDGRGITYKGGPVVPGEAYSVDDDLILWLTKIL